MTWMPCWLTRPSAAPAWTPYRWRAMCPADRAPAAGQGEEGGRPHGVRRPVPGERDDSASAIAIHTGANCSAVLCLARISHRLNPRLRGGAASPEAGRAEDYSGYENRGEDRKMRSEMPMDGLCLLEDDGVDTRCLSALRSSSSGGRIGQVAELG